MNHFFVRSLNQLGQNRYEFIEAKNHQTLLDQFEQRQVIPLGITRIPQFLSLFIPSIKGNISKEEVIELMESMHLITKSGLPLHHGLIDLTEESKNKHFKQMLFRISNDIRMGKSLSKAFEPYSDIIGIVTLNLIRIGEETGRLETTLQRSSIFLHRITALQKKAKSALIYPTFAFVTVMGAMLVWMIFVLPQMVELFKEMDIELPSTTLFIMNLSDFLSAWIFHLIGGIAVVLLLFKILHKKYRRVRLFADRIMLKTPLVKHIISGFNIAFISEYLRLALASGVPLLGALDTIKENIGNEVFKEALINGLEGVKRGNQLSTSFKKDKLFSPFMLRMMGVGESTGTLESQLGFISEHYYKKVDYYAENIGKFIEPVIMLIVGGFMAFIMVGLMGPMYDLIGAIE